MTIKAAELLALSERVDCGDVNRHPFELYTKQDIELDSGISVFISNMNQFHTYGGMLCGFPLLDQADWYVEQAAKAAERLMPNTDIQRAAIFPPPITFGTTIKKVTPQLAKLLGLGPEVKEERIAWEMFPKITTVAVLQMTTSFDSVLAIWWQGELGYPDANVLNQIKKLCWADHVINNDT